MANIFKKIGQNLKKIGKQLERSVRPLVPALVGAGVGVYSGRPDLGGAVLEGLSSPERGSPSGDKRKPKLTVEDYAREFLLLRDGQGRRTGDWQRWLLWIVGGGVLIVGLILLFRRR